MMTLSAPTTWIDGKWIDIGPTNQIEPGMAATLPVEGGEEIAIFHTKRGEFYALVNKCPHKGGPLSQGIVHGDSVSCPLHSFRISLLSGKALGDDKGCTPTIEVKVDSGRIYLLREALMAAALPALSPAASPAAPSTKAA